MYNEKHLLKNNSIYNKSQNKQDETRRMYDAEVISIDDVLDGGRIKVRIPELDKDASNADLPYSYPLLPKIFHFYPKIGECVRVLVENKATPQTGRLWVGSVFSQLSKINFESKYTALSTTGKGVSTPDIAPSTITEANGVFPKLDTIAILGRNNADLQFRNQEVELRVGQHEIDNPLKRNIKNTGSILMSYHGDDTPYTSTIIRSDKIALISHNGNPKIKSTDLTNTDIDDIFNICHPTVRGDVLVKIMDVFRQAIIGHIHGYSNISADKNDIINDLEKLNLESLLQKNIVIN